MKYHKTLITEGAWRIINQRDPGDSYHRMQHRCVPNRQDSGWCDRYFHPESRGWACPWCNKVAPEGIQVLFLFLKDHEYHG
jgi:hypothetical protein